ncbi:hypothetical protein HYH03_011438 [Edaphochlamys debaryana]|uniref:Uncharacterized protein n=1 Tax=Edaphochlamys debaryana TaxID=47281 RepID=A0A835XW44_9CHLO|nr:hypothetical protein HYH03_011438 [Edaphochlamys debaryana]|eukprot:KAG2490133.1 hypothetical protein HYH03_011438 [Edaphochlamys debaryana]
MVSCFGGRPPEHESSGTKPTSAADKEAKKAKQLKSRQRKKSGADVTAPVQSSGKTSTEVVHKPYTGPVYWPYGPAWLPFGPKCMFVKLGVVRPLLPPEVKAAHEAREARAARLAEARLQRLRHLRPVVLDTTLLEMLETDVGPLPVDPDAAAARRAETFRLIKGTGVYKYLASVEVGGRVILPNDLARRGLICGNCAGMVLLYDGLDAQGLPNQALPEGMTRLKEYRIQTVLLECDLTAAEVNWDKLGAEGYVSLIASRCRWVHSELAWALRVAREGLAGFAPSTGLVRSTKGPGLVSKGSGPAINGVGTAAAAGAGAVTEAVQVQANGSSSSSSNQLNGPSSPSSGGGAVAAASVPKAGATDRPSSGGGGTASSRGLAANAEPSAAVASTSAAAAATSPGGNGPAAPNGARDSRSRLLPGGAESGADDGTAGAAAAEGVAEAGLGTEKLPQSCPVAPVSSTVGSAPAEASSAGIPPATVWVHLANFPTAMRQPASRSRLLDVVRRLAALPEPLRPAGLLFEDRQGQVAPFELAPMCAAVRRAMRESGWPRGHLLVHVAHGYGFAEASTIECLASGADGVWAGVCDEGPVVGHASSLVTLVNLARLGNPHVAAMYDLPKLREIAIEATKIATGLPPHPRTEVYGARALDVCFDSSMGDDGTGMVAAMLGTENEIRITTMVTPEMIIARLGQTFGPYSYTKDHAQAMLEVLHHDLLVGEREDYNSPVGLATLWERSGQTLTPAMLKVLSDASEAEHHPLVLELKELWDQWAVQEAEMGHTDVPAGCLSYTSFYHGFMGKYFSCFSCDVTAEAYALFALERAGAISWSALLLRLKWGLVQHGEQIRTADELVQVVFEKLIIPEIVARFKRKVRKQAAAAAAAGGKSGDAAAAAGGAVRASGGGALESGDGVPRAAVEGVAPELLGGLQKAATIKREELYEEWKGADVANDQVGVNRPVTEII